MQQSFLASFLWVLVTVLRVFLLLLVELIATMLLYIYLNFYHIETFGYLVRLARSLLDVMGGLVDSWLPGSANSAYATLIGEMGPKSFLLLTFGLIVAAVIRSLVHFGVTVIRSRPLVLEGR